MPELTPFPVDRSDVTAYYEALAATLAGDGPALAPYPAGDDAPVVPANPSDAPSYLALVMATSGSTGTPKRALLSRSSVLASAEATLDRLGGPGTWLLPLPPAHIAGTQVLVRSIVAGTTPTVMDAWSVEMFVKATALVARNAPPFSPIYTSLVPTQLHDVLADARALEAARRYRAILVGGAATPAPLKQAALDAGLAIRTTYGSSETAGGCVYDGRPLDGVEVTVLDPDPDGLGRIALRGPMVASGYLDAAPLTRERFTLTPESNTYVTDDLGYLRDGVLTITGRLDDVIISGGYKISPHIVEEVVASVPGLDEVLCLGLSDERRGSIVAVAVAAHDPAIETNLLRERILNVCVERLPPYAVPRRLARLERLPMRGIGKPDRAAIAENSHWRSLHGSE